MKNKKIWDYFDDNIEYPKEVSDKILPYNEVWTYVSSTFLNGFINYVKPIGCYVINRYTTEDSKIEGDFTVCDKGEFGKWFEFDGTKKELIDSIISGDKEMYHTQLNCFSDDLIILARIENELDEQNKYMFFWFDMDVSDCSIGRFISNDSEKEILTSIENWLTDEFYNEKRHEETHSEQSKGFHKLPLSFLKGWLKF